MPQPSINEVIYCWLAQKWPFSGSMCVVWHVAFVLGVGCVKLARIAHDTQRALAASDDTPGASTILVCRRSRQSRSVKSNFAARA